MRFTVVSPEGAEYGAASLDVYREKFKPLGYLIAREQPPYDDWGVPEGAEEKELTPDPNAKPKRTARAEKPQETGTDAA